jgi:excisionase family DNA binding protein
MDDLQPDQLMVSPRKAEQMLGISKATVYVLLKNGSLQSRKVGKARRISVESIRQYAAAGTAE